MEKLTCVICEKKLNGNRTKFCGVECVNKYRKLPYNEYKRNSYHRQSEKHKERKFKLISLRNNKGCEKCNYNKNIAALDFHHIDSSTKLFKLDARNLSNRRWESILKEFEKCEILCANCHREEHFPELELLCANDYINLFDSNNSKNEILKCVDCGVDVTKKSKRCSNCDNIKNRKIKKRPTLNKLSENIIKMGYLKTGEIFGVSETTIRRWIKCYGIDPKTITKAHNQ